MVNSTTSATNETASKEKNNKKMPQWVKITAITLASVFGFIVLVLGSYIAYLSIQYYRIEDNYVLEVKNQQSAKVELNKNYSICTYNIGFGAYSKDFSFFMDSGTMKTGEKIQGTGSTAKDKNTVLYNTNGAVDAVKELNCDFYFFQEVDTNSTRSYAVNQYDILTSVLASYTTTYAINFHCGYLAYPITNPHGSVNSGIATHSKYAIESSTRRSFPIDMGFFQKFFDLDRCFAVNRLKIDGTDKELVLINLHMSAYDEGGLIRAEQLKLLNSVLKEEYEKGNYVIAGGDFNHDIVNSLNMFETTQEVPEWVFQLTNENLAEHFSFAGATNCPTCRSSDMGYEKGVNYSVVIDGFVVSDNVQVIENKNIDLDFEYSDHNPATMTFKLV